MHPDTVCQHLDISGKVQGVGFRVALQDTARAMQLTGWVRNRRDGRVEALLQGRQSDLDAMRAWCHRGPPLAHVDAVAVTPRPTDPSLVDMQCLATA